MSSASLMTVWQEACHSFIPSSVEHCETFVFHSEDCVEQSLLLVRGEDRCQEHYENWAQFGVSALFLVIDLPGDNALARFQDIALDFRPQLTQPAVFQSRLREYLAILDVSLPADQLVKPKKAYALLNDRNMIALVAASETSYSAFFWEALA